MTPPAFIVHLARIETGPVGVCGLPPDENVRDLVSLNGTLQTVTCPACRAILGAEEQKA